MKTGSLLITHPENVGVYTEKTMYSEGYTLSGLCAHKSIW